MKTKILVSVITVLALTIAVAKAQEKKMTMKRDSTKMMMKHDKMMKHNDMKAKKMTYTCAMHPKVTSDKPGKCPECGMKLMAKKMSEKMMMKHDSTKMKMKHDKMMKHNDMKAKKMTYTCTMHPKVTSDKPGKCPECGMKLMEKKTSGKMKKHEEHNH